MPPDPNQPNPSVAVAPEYGSGSLAEVLPSVCDALRVPGGWDHFGIGDTRRAVVLLIDGLGSLQLGAHRDIAPTIAAADRGPITSVFPSTTPTALTSLGTGLPPGGHGLIGAVFRYRGAPFAPLSWGEAPSALAVQPQHTWWERARDAGVHVTNVSPRQHRSGGLTAAAFRGSDWRGADTVGERVAEIAAAARRGSRSLVYGYWEGLDKTAHVHGVDSPHYRWELRAVDAFVAAVAQSLPEGCRLVVTADHGVLDCDEAVQVDTPDLMDGVEMLLGEPRVRQVFVRPGRAPAVAAAWSEALGGSAEVLTRAELARIGYLGDLAAEYADRVADVIALAAPGVRLAAPSRDAVLSGLRGQHGGLTAEEMLVPLAVYDI